MYDFILDTNNNQFYSIVKNPGIVIIRRLHFERTMLVKS